MGMFFDINSTVSVKLYMNDNWMVLNYQLYMFPEHYKTQITICLNLIETYILCVFEWYPVKIHARFTYRLDRLKPRASKFKRTPAKVYIIFNTVNGLSHLFCHNVLYFLNNPSVIFLTQLHSISEYCWILNMPRHPCLFSNWLCTLPSSSSREGGVLGGASQVE